MKKSRVKLCKFILMSAGLTVFATGFSQVNKSNNKPFSDKETSAKVEKVFARLTDEDKLAQLIGVSPFDIMKDGKLSLELCKKKMPNGIGHLCQYSSTLSMKPEVLRDFVRELQHYLMTETHSGIPAIFHGEALSGFATLGATTLPQQIGMGCSWNPDLVERNTQYTARKMRDGGATLALSPVLDVINNAHWSRIEESFGEEPYLVGRMGLAFVNGLQGNNLRTGVAVTTKHFVGYGGEFNDKRSIYEDALFPHEVAIKLGGSKSLMPNYSKFQGEYSIASDNLLHNILRKHLGFDGLVVSDYGAMGTEAGKVKNPTTLKEAGARCLNAGADVEFPNEMTFTYLLDAMKEGKVSRKTFDDAVKRVLTLKAKLGLLDDKPVFGTDGVLDYDKPAERKLAYQSACQSLVLLKNNGVLPLNHAIRKIAVVGPNAATFQSLTGDYTYQALTAFWWNFPTNPEYPKLVTLLQGLKAKAGKDVVIQHERGCDWSAPLDSKIDTTTPGDNRLSKVKMLTIKGLPQPNLANALKIAQESDVIIAAMGENLYLCGEARERKGIKLPGEQEAFVQKLIATGKPVVLVLFGGRQQVITDLEPKCAAIIQAWYPGEEGGNAVADVLLGNENPSGKLCVTYPKSEEQQKLSYSEGYQSTNEPLYPFGYGLSYTSYQYENLSIAEKAKIEDKWIPVSFKVKNTGLRDGAEIVQLYVATKGLSVPMKVRQLKGFQRVDLKSGEEKTVTFKVSPQQFAYYDTANDKWVIEAGKYEFLAGASSQDIRLKKTLELIGEKRVIDERTVYFSENK